MSRFNPREHAFILYLKLNDVRCHKLIEKYNIPKRGAQIGIQDLELLVAETPGGKDTLLLQHPWLRTGYPILVNTQTDKKFFGFMDVDAELRLYHEHLDAYHASIMFKKQQTLPGVTSNGIWSQSQDVRPAPLIAAHQAPHPQNITQQNQLPPVKSEAKKMAAVPVALPPKQDPEKISVLVPEPTDWSKIIQKAESAQPTEPLLSEQARANGSLPSVGLAPAGLPPVPPSVASVPLEQPQIPQHSLETEEPMVDLEQGVEQPIETGPIEVLTVPIPPPPPPKKSQAPKQPSKQPQPMRPRTVAALGPGHRSARGVSIPK